MSISTVVKIHVLEMVIKRAGGGFLGIRRKGEHCTLLSNKKQTNRHKFSKTSPVPIVWLFKMSGGEGFGFP